MIDSDMCFDYDETSELSIYIYSNFVMSVIAVNYKN